MSVSTKQFHETNFLVCHIINILLTLVGYLRTLDARGLLARQRRGASERVVLRDSPSLLRHSILLPPTRKKTSGTQGITWEKLDIDVTEKQIFYPRPSTLDTLPSTLDPRPSTKTYTRLSTMSKKLDRFSEKNWKDIMYENLKTELHNVSK